MKYHLFPDHPVCFHICYGIVEVEKSFTLRMKGGEREGVREGLEGKLCRNIMRDSILIIMLLGAMNKKNNGEPFHSFSIAHSYTYTHLTIISSGVREGLRCIVCVEREKNLAPSISNERKKGVHVLPRNLICDRVCSVKNCLYSEAIFMIRETCLFWKQKDLWHEFYRSRPDQNNDGESDSYRTGRCAQNESDENPSLMNSVQSRRVLSLLLSFWAPVMTRGGTGVWPTNLPGSRPILLFSSPSMTIEPLWRNRRRRQWRRGPKLLMMRLWPSRGRLHPSQPDPISLRFQSPTVENH